MHRRNRFAAFLGRRHFAGGAGSVPLIVVAERRPAIRVGVKVRFAPFFTHTRSMTLDHATSDAAELEAAAIKVLDRFEDRRPVRLLGVRAEFVR